MDYFIEVGMVYGVVVVFIGNFGICWVWRREMFFIWCEVLCIVGSVIVLVVISVVVGCNIF